MTWPFQPLLPGAAAATGGGGAGYDPSVLDWLPRGSPPARAKQRPVPARLVVAVAVTDVAHPQTLDWLPRGSPPQQRKRADISRSLYPLQPPAAAPYDPSDLAWQPSGRVAPRAPRTLQSVATLAPSGWRDATQLDWLPRGEYAPRYKAQPKQDLSLYPLQPPVTSYDPSDLAWLTSTSPTLRKPRAAEAVSVYPLQPPAVAPYDPSDLAWQPSYRGVYARTLPRPIQTRSVVALSVDDQNPGGGGEGPGPSALEWLPIAAYQPRGLRPLVRNDRTETVALWHYPALLDWLPREGPRARARTRASQDLSLYPLQPPPAAPYDPSDLAWSVRGAPRAFPRPRHDISRLAFQHIVVPYDPSTMEWIPRGAYMVRALPYPRVAPYGNVSAEVLPPPAPVTEHHNRRFISNVGTLMGMR